VSEIIYSTKWVG